MEAPGIVPNSTVCPACGKEIILAGQEGLTHMDCPYCGVPTVVPVQFNEFVLLNAIGFGGMGTVYKAMDLALNRMLAIKILRKKLAANSAFLDNFRREAQAAAAVNHPNVARVFSFGEHEGQCYLVMELLERGSLDDRLTKIGKLPEIEALNIGIQIAGGLRAAYATGLLHRDVKPGNILFNDQGVPKIVDFGLARPADDKKSAANEPEPIWGTPYYIAPEKLTGHPEDTRSDIYSLGATLFHAMAGRPPFDAATATDVAVKHATTPAYSLKTYLPTVQDTTAQVIGRMLAKNPNERFANYDQLITELERAKRVIEENEKKPIIVTESGERVSVFSLLGTGTALLLLAAAAVFLWIKRDALFGEQKIPPPSTTTKIVTQQIERTTVKLEDVNFNEDTPDGPAWSKAAANLAAGNIPAALIEYRKIETKFLFQPNQLHWIYYAKGIALLLDNQLAAATNALSQAEDSTFQHRIPPTVTHINFVSPLASTLLYKIPQKDMDDPIFPQWAAALNHFNAGLYTLRATRATNHMTRIYQYNLAVTRFNRYANAKPSDEEKWLYAFQPLATELARECHLIQPTIDKAESFFAEGKKDLALNTLLDMQSQLHIPFLRARLQHAYDTLEHRVKIADQQQKEKQRAEQERIKQEQLAAQRRAEEEKLAALERTKAADAKLLDESADTQKKFIATYDFTGLLAHCTALAPKLKTDDARAQHTGATARARALAGLKTKLAAAFKQRPYDGASIRQNTGTAFIGKLTGVAPDDKLIFTLDEGSLLREWRELAPTTIINIGLAYAQTDTLENTAQWYFHLAVFARQYGFEQLAASYAKEAARLQPSLDATLKATGIQ